MATHIGRRKFLATLGGAAAWPLAARGQQPAMPVLGSSPAPLPLAIGNTVAALGKGLRQADHSENGRNQ